MPMLLRQSKPVVMPMSQRATRLLLLLDELRRRRTPVRGAQLAEQLGVSLRTLYRDIDVLRGQGADIGGDPGVGYLLRGGFLMPAMMFSAEELEAVVLGTRWVASHGDPELAAAAGNALDRIVGVLPGALRLQVETSGLFAPLWGGIQPEPWLPVLRRAIRDGHVVHIRYRDGEAGTASGGSGRSQWPSSTRCGCSPHGASSAVISVTSAPTGCSRWQTPASAIPTSATSCCGDGSSSGCDSTSSDSPTWTSTLLPLDVSSVRADWPLFSDRSQP
jgi:Predicted transcriptional regulator